MADASPAVARQELTASKLSGILHWTRVGGFAVADQAFFSGTSFLTTVLLARWLSVQGFAAYTLAFSVLVLLITLHSALLTEPMSVFGVGTYADRFPRYLRMILQGHMVFSAVMALLLGGAGLLLILTGSASIGSAVLGLAGALPFVLLPWLLRRAFYVQFAPQYAALGGATYALLMVAALAGLESFGALSATTAFLAAGACSLPVSALLYVLLRPRIAAAGPPSRRQEVREGGAMRAGAVVHDHLRYARWAAPAALTIWIASYAHYFALSSVAKLDQAAAMRALEAVLAPYWQYLAALTGFLLPVFTRRITESTEQFGQFTLQILGIFLAQALVAWVALSLLAGPLLSLLYPGKYSGYAHYFPLMSLMLVPETLSVVLLVACRSLVRTGFVFLYNAILAVSLLIGFFAAAGWGIWGIVTVRLIVSFSLLIVFFRVVYPVLKTARPLPRPEVQRC